MARKRYKKDKRIDMRQGGRVQLKAGSMPKKIEEPKEIIQPEDLYPRGNTPNDHNLDIPLDFKKDPMPLRDPRVPSPSVGTPDPLPPLPKDILRDPAPAPEKERPQTVSISQPQPQAGNIFPEVQQDLQEKQAKLQADLEAKVRKLEAELQLEREKNIRKMNMERPDG